MKIPDFTVPAPLAMLARPLPRWPLSAALAHALDAGVGRLVDAAAIAPIEGRRVRLAVRDLDLAVTVECRGGRFHAAAGDALPDVTFEATLRDYAALALRTEDPDTLFFARRLRVEGDTELGLVVKNLLDGIDFAALAPWRVPVSRRSG